MSTPVHAIVKSAIAVVRTRRELSAFMELVQDSKSETVLKKKAALQKKFSKSLDELDAAVVKLSRQPPPKDDKKPFDWAGIAKAGIAIAKAVNQIKNPKSEPFGDVIDAEVVP